MKKLGTFLFFLGVLIGICIMVFITNRPKPPQPTEQERALTPIATVLSADTIVSQLTSVTKLVTAEAIVETVVELENNTQYITWRSGNFIVDEVITTFDKALGKRYIVMQGRGTIKAGVDLSKLDIDRDIEITTDGSITIELPPSKLVGNAEIDFAYTHPLALEHGILISKNDFTITEQGYTEVGKQLNQKVCDANVLGLAEEHAKETVDKLVRAFNPELKNVIINSKSGNCGE
jgi:hypothetical protein